jgi:hypothetical protein
MPQRTRSASRVGVRLLSKTCRRRASRSVAESDPKPTLASLGVASIRANNYLAAPRAIIAPDLVNL